MGDYAREFAAAVTQRLAGASIGALVLDAGTQESRSAGSRPSGRGPLPGHRPRSRVAIGA